MTVRLAAALSGIMIFLWGVLLHIARAAVDIRSSNETTAVFEALAMSGAAFLVAATCRERHSWAAEAKETFQLCSLVE
jgi:hypothetical protein